jgi:NADPH-dependent glutamate synthase beta subunit-like oxidoreductase
VSGLRTQPAKTSATPTPSDTETTFWASQLVLIAVGFNGPEQNQLMRDAQLKTNPSGSIWTDANYMTSCAGVFAAGDMRRGQSLVVWAIAEGRKAATAIDQFLTQTTQLPQRRERSGQVESSRGF